jgi:hypothetical protein
MMKENINKMDIDTHFNTRRIDKMLIIKGERGEMDIKSIYYYVTLMKLLTINDEELLENKNSFIFR